MGHEKTMDGRMWFEAAVILRASAAIPQGGPCCLCRQHNRDDALKLDSPVSEIIPYPVTEAPLICIYRWARYNPSSLPGAVGYGSYGAKHFFHNLQCLVDVS